MPKASQSQMKRAALSALSVKSTPPLTAELFATMPTLSPVDAAEADDELAGPERLELEEGVVVDEAVDDVVDVEGHRLALGHGLRR